MEASSEPHSARGPLHGTRIVEVAGIGAAPFCGMMLADMGAEVIRVNRPSDVAAPAVADPLLRNRRSVVIDLKRHDGLAVLLDLADHADALFEAFRPGVAERLGFGPEACLARNPRLVYGRLTGWGQAGPLASTAGHDINYIALSGALNAIGPRGGSPVPPLNLVGDFGGGGMLMAFGIVCALLEVGRSGRGQVVDAAMVDGALAQMAQSFGLQAAGRFDGAPGADLLSGGAPFYGTYETADGKFVAVGALEPQFFGLLLDTLEIDRDRFAGAGFQGALEPMDTHKWPELRRALADRFREKSRDEWAAVFAHSDACVTPVLALSETPRHPQHRSRNALIEPAGVAQPAPAPRFSRSCPEPPRAPVPAGHDTDAVLQELGYDRLRIEALRNAGAVF